MLEAPDHIPGFTRGMMDYVMENFNELREEYTTASEREVVVETPINVPRLPGKDINNQRYVELKRKSFYLGAAEHQRINSITEC